MALMSLLATACASGAKNPNACTVRVLEGKYTGETTVEDEVAFVGAGCFTGKFGCKWKETRFDGDWIEIDGALSSVKGRAASFKDGKLVLKPDSVIGSAVTALAEAIAGDIRVDWGKDQTVQIFQGKTPVTKYQHSSTCSKREVALGVTVLFYH